MKISQTMKNIIIIHNRFYIKEIYTHTYFKTFLKNLNAQQTFLPHPMEYRNSY